MDVAFTVLILKICCSPAQPTANRKYFTLTHTGFVPRVLRECLPASWLNTAVATPYRRHAILQRANSGPFLPPSPFSVVSMCFVDKQGNTLAGRLYVLPPPPLLHTWNVHLTHLIQFTNPRNREQAGKPLGELNQRCVFSVVSHWPGFHRVAMW